MGAGEDEAEPAKEGLEHAKLPPGEGGGDGGEGGEAQHDGQAVGHHPGQQVGVGPPIPGVGRGRHHHHLGPVPPLCAWGEGFRNR